MSLSLLRMSYPDETDDLRTAVEMVRSGEEIAPAAEMMGVTVAALRTACRLAGVSPASALKSQENHAKTKAKRTAACVARFKAGETLPQIRDREAVSMRFVCRVLTEAGLGDFPLPPRNASRRPSEKARRADALARTWLANRGTPRHVSITTLAKKNHLSADTVATAIRRVKAAKKLLDRTEPVTDTPLSRT